MSNKITDIKLSGVTYQIEDSTAIHSMDGYWTSGQTEDAITAATGALAETIAEELSGKVDTSAFTVYSAATNTVLEGKADKSEIPSVSGYADSVQYNDTSHYMEFYHGGTGGTKVYEFDASPFLVDGMIEDVEIVDYLPIPSVAQDKVKLTWADGYNVTTDVDNPYTGDIEHGINDVVKAEFGKMSKQPINDVLFNGDNCYQLSSVTYCDAAYFSEDCTDFASAFKLNEINFFATSPSGFTYSPYECSNFLSTVYDGCETYETTAATYPIKVASLANYSGATITNIDGTPTTWGAYFGNRLQEIPTIKALKIDFNTASGKEDIYIPLSEIFDPSNYYTKSEIDAALSGKADTSAVTSVNDVLTAHTSNNDIHVTTSDKSTWSGKQDALVSGTNIKTINNQSILGSGNIDVQTLPTVSGTTLIFS